MPARIRPLCSDDIDAVVQLSLAAWEPVFLSFRSVLGPEIYTRLYPDWKQSQAEAGYTPLPLVRYYKALD